MAQMEWITNISATELAGRIRQGEISIREAVEASLAKIGEREEKLNCYITIDRQGALAEADRLWREMKSGNIRGALLGVPFAVKDNLCTKGLRTSCGSAMLKDFIPPYDAGSVQALRKAGAIVLGKTNMDEFAMGSTTETSFFGPTQNPVREGYVPGGSSGGSAAALAADECFAALGSDTGGSVRQPASHCGVVGLKPSYGLVSRFGLIAYASSMDQVGVFAKNTEDCAVILQTIAGRDERDATSVSFPGKNYMEELKKGADGLRIGILKEAFGCGTAPSVKEALLQAAALLKSCGAVAEEVTVLDPAALELALPAYYTIACAEASSNLERYDGVKYGLRSEEQNLRDLYRKTRTQGFGGEVKRRILLGTFVLSEGYYEAYYLKALQVRRLIKNAYDKAFEDFDLLLGPVAPDTAPGLGEELRNPLKMYQSDVDTIAANLTGLPAISVPCGSDEKGLPIGMQLTAGYGREDLLLRAAYAFEQAGKREERHESI